MCWKKRRPPAASRKPTQQESVGRSLHHHPPAASHRASLPSSSFSSSFSSASLVDFTSSSSSIHGFFDGPFLYKHAEIAASTNSLDPSLQLGGSVWRGTLRGSSVAIVRRTGIATGFRKLLKAFSALHHSSLVKLLGACKAREYVFLAYELVEGNDLASSLDNKLSPGYTALSTWRLRMQVAVDVAKGLEYLHEQCIPRSVHKHLYSSSILVMNETLRAKIAYVGMAAITGEVEVQFSTTKKIEEADEQSKPTQAGSIKIQGRRGYMAPEYVIFGEATQKYDVFAFGVVLVELLKGKEAKGTVIDELRTMVEDRDGLRRNIRLWIDRRLRDAYPVEDAVKVALLACSCLDNSPDHRPRMSEVSAKLARILDSATLWEKERDVMDTNTLQGR